MGSVAVLNALAWLAGVIPGLFSDSPAFLKGTGLTTMPTYVQDLAFWLPLMAVSAVLLWHRQAWGYLLVGWVARPALYREHQRRGRPMDGQRR